MKDCLEYTIKDTLLLQGLFCLVNTKPTVAQEIVVRPHGSRHLTLNCLWMCMNVIEKSAVNNSTA